MADNMQVKTDELRASARAADILADDNDTEISAALKGTRTAADSLSGWSLGAQLTATAADWESGLKGLQSRIRKSAQNLRTTANSTDSTESHVARTMRDVFG
ncbi:hypothetical protein [Streptomyces bluensis]|uniref:Excreted virulence factor EspC (Type VII ESX diderm) n=1 Tax=Streptomyces bluensis TaxID=33897 RepID=A0ABW6UDS0_9ACTN